MAENNKPKFLETAKEKVVQTAAEASPLWLFEQAFKPAKALAQLQVAQLKKRYPTKSNAEIIAILERRYLSETTALGAATGAVAAAPGAGTAAALGLTLAETGSFLSATAVHVFAVMEVLEIELVDVDHERALVMGIMLGGSGSKTIEMISQRTGKHWGKLLVEKTPTSMLKQVNKTLGRNFVTKYGTKQGIIVLGKITPFGIGAAIGGGLNHLMARGMLAGCRRTLHEVGEASGIAVAELEVLDGEVVEEEFLD